MERWLGAHISGDPGRVHTEGRTARAVVEDAREAVADLVGARPREVVFTSGATEAANAAAWGAVRAAPDGAAVLCADVEHSAVRDGSARLAPVVVLPVDRQGRIDPEGALEAGARAQREHNGVAVVHCQWANHEVGTLQPVAELVEVAHRLGALAHVDAAVAVGHVPVDFSASGADLMSVSAHKLGGPPGIGALLVRRGLRLESFVVGGDQERARRAGFENVPAAAGFGAAARILRGGGGRGGGALAGESERARLQTDRVLEAVDGVNGTEGYGDRSRRVPHIACFGVSGVEAEAVVLGLDGAGIAVHSGSACSSESLEPSPVLVAMGVDAERSIRVSVGWSTGDADVDALAETLPRVVEGLRSLR